MQKRDKDVIVIFVTITFFLYLFDVIKVLKRVKPQSRVNALSELCSPLLKRGNSAFIAVIASVLFSKSEYQSLE